MTTNKKEPIFYMGAMDNQCIPICDAINKIPGLRTIESCCGHGDTEFKIWFKVISLEKLPILLYYIDPCHVGFRWNCLARTDCSMAPVTFMLESESKGDEAYREANEIAKKIEEELA